MTSTFKNPNGTGADNDDSKPHLKQQRALSQDNSNE